MEFKCVSLEKISVFFSIYLLLGLSLSICVVANDETRSFEERVIVKNPNDPENLEVSPTHGDVLTIATIDIESSNAPGISCGKSGCDTPCEVLSLNEELSEGRIPLYDYVNEQGNTVNVVVNPYRWSVLASRVISGTEFEVYFLDQQEYDVADIIMEDRRKVYVLHNSERLRETLDDVASTGTSLCAGDLLSDAKHESMEQMMNIYASVSTYWYILTHFMELISASLQSYMPVCNLGGLKNLFGAFFSNMGGNMGEWGGKASEYSDTAFGLASDAYGLYEEYYPYVEAAMTCKETYDDVKGIHGDVTGLKDKFDTYLTRLENPLPECLGTTTGKLQGLLGRLNGLRPDFLPEFDGFLGSLEDVFPDCAQDFLGRTEDFKNLLGRFNVAFPSYCSKVQAMEQHYESMGNKEMANKYAALYTPCQDGGWGDLPSTDLLPTGCTDLEGLTVSGIMPEDCRELSSMDLSSGFTELMPTMSLPDSCTDYKSLLGDMLLCGNTYDFEFPDVSEDGEVSC